MSEWVTPVTDRTQQDVTYARKNQGRIGIVVPYNKGALNFPDLNRIEGNYKYVIEQLQTDAIFIPHKDRNYTETWINSDGETIQQTYTDWAMENLPDISEMNRIRDNINALITLFLVNMGFTEFVKSNYLNYQEVNGWENMLLQSKIMFENMVKEYIYCGTINCGGDRLI